MLLTIAFPVYNESANIESILEETTTYLESISRERDFEWEILVVDDGSKDDTPHILKNMRDHIPNLKIITHEINRGYRGAVQSCLENTIGNYIVVMDSDGQFKINDLPKFLDKCVLGYDLVLGNKIKRNDPLIRILLGKGYNFLFRILFKAKLNEVDCGFRLLSNELSKKIQLGDGNLPIGPEIAVTALMYGYKIGEVPVSHYLRKGGKTVFPMSKLPSTILSAFGELIRLKINSRKREKIS